MNLSALDLNLLKVLDALLRDPSTTRAGARVGLSQPAASAALARLRGALGDPLFLRRGQRLEPTDFARSLALPLRAHLDGLERLLSQRDDFEPADADGSFRIAGTDFFAEMLMPRLAAEAGTMAPRLTLQLLDLVPDDYIDTLERYLVDLALVPRMEVPDWVNTRPVFHSSFVVISRRGHARIARLGLAEGAALPLDLYCDLGHVLMSPEGRLTSVGDAALARLGRSRRVALTLPFFSGVCRAVAESDLVALVPRQVAGRVAEMQGLAIHAPPMPLPPALLTMIWHRRSDGNPAHRWLRGLIAELLAPLNEGEPPLPGLPPGV